MRSYHGRMPEAQSFKNHTRRDPPYLFAVVVFLANFLSALVVTVRIAVSREPHRLGHHVWLTVVSLALVVVAANMRVKDLRVQDRVIRIEERLRYAAMLQPADQVAATSLSVNQMIALRFASDGDLPALIRRAVAEGLTSKQIKQSIVSWRADDFRV